MEFNEYFLVLKRRFALFISIILILLIGASIVGFAFVPRYKATTMMTFSLQDTKITQAYEYSNFYAEQAALEFTRTISGWYKDPRFQEHVFRAADIPFGEENTLKAKLFGFFSMKREERQNILTTFSATTEERANKLADGIKRVVVHRLDTYNIASNSQYKLAYDTVWVEKQETPWMILIVGALFLGLVLGILLVYMVETFSGVVILNSRTEEILEKKPFDILKIHRGKDQRYFRMRMLEEKPFNSVLSLAKNHSIIAGYKLPLYNFPNDTAKFKEIKETILVLIQLGSTLEIDLFRVRKLLEGKKWQYVILQ